MDQTPKTLYEQRRDAILESREELVMTIAGVNDLLMRFRLARQNPPRKWTADDIAKIDDAEERVIDIMAKFRLQREGYERSLELLDELMVITSKEQSERIMQDMETLNAEFADRERTLSPMMKGVLAATRKVLEMGA